MTVVVGADRPSTGGDSSPSPAAVELGRRLGIEVVDELGRGATTVVYRVVRGGETYALKIMLSAVESDRAEAAFRREALLLAGVDHPGVCRIHEVGRVHDRAYLIMDFVEGQPLSQKLAGQTVSPEAVVRIGCDLASLLAAAHVRGLVHRDIKPHNIIIGPDGRATLIDFGLVARARLGPDGAPTEIAGTLLYSSPEQAGMLHRPVDGRSDLYSLGVVLFECIAGEPPFSAVDVGELLRRHAVDPPPDLRRLRPDAPPALITIIERLLAKDPDDRYQRADTLVNDLLVLEPALARTVYLPVAAAPQDAAGDHGLVGRERELAQLRHRWSQARAGRGGAVVITGGRGTGKTRLGREFAAMVSRDGLPVLQGRCVEADPVPLAALRLAVDGYLDRTATLPEAERDEALVRVRAAARRAGGLLRTLSPKLVPLLPSEPAGMSVEQDRQEQFAIAVALFLADLARAHAGMVLCLDDVQWLDDATSRVLAQLAVELADAPLLVVAESALPADSPTAPAARPGGLPVDLRLDLGTLDDQAIIALLTGMLPGVEVPAELTAGILRLCQGNPLAVVEHVRAVVDSALLHPDWGRWRLDPRALDRLDLPADTARLPLARLDEFDGTGRGLFTAAAIVGTTFDPPLLAMVTDLTEGQVLDYLTRADELGLLERLPDGRHSFIHPHLRASLLAAADPVELRRVNHATARYLAATGAGADERIHTYAVARHFMNGDPTRDRTAAFDACWAAGRLALAEHAPAEALLFLNHAAALAEGTLNAAFLRTVGTALQRDGQFDQAQQRLEQALELETAPLQRAHLFNLLAQVHRSRWQTSAAMRTVRRGLAELGHPLPRGFRLLLFTVAMTVAAGIVELTRLGRGTLTGERRERYLLRASLHSSGGYAAALSSHPEIMAALYLSSLYLVARVGESPECGRAYCGVGVLLRLCHLDGLARRALARANRIAHAVGDLRLAAQVAWDDAIGRYLRGMDDGESLEEVTKAQGRWLDVGSYCDGAAALASQALLRGDTTEGAQWLNCGHERLQAQGITEQTPLAALDLSVPASLGQAAEAGRRYQLVKEILDSGKPDRSLQLALIIAAVLAMLNQEDVGERVESMLSRFAALKIFPPLLLRFHLQIYAYQAMTRLARCRTAPAGQLPALLPAARAAVRVLRRTAREPLLRAYYEIARAELRRIEGHPDAALAILDRVRPLRRDAPLVAHEVARTRARAYQDLGHHAEARRSAKTAITIAQDHGWPHRARQVAAEFFVDAAMTGARHGSRSPVPASTASAPHAGNIRQRLAALQQVGQAASRILDPSELARIALDETIKIFAADRAFLFLTEGADNHLVPHLGRDSAGCDVTEVTAYSASVVERVRDAREPLVVTGTDEGEALGSRSVVVHGLRSILAAPLQLEERLLGVVYLDSRVAKGIFTADDVGILTAITNHIAVSLETARAAQLDADVKSAQRERDVAESLRTALTEMSTTLSPDGVIDHLLRSMARMLPGRVRLIRNDGSCVEIAAEDAPDGNDVSGGTPERVEALTAWLRARSTTTAAVYSGSQARRLDATLGPAAFWLVVPLTVRGQRLGTVVLSRDDPYDTTHAEIAAALAAQAMVAYDNAELFTKVERMASLDALTGLLNRRAFFGHATRELEHSRAAGRRLAALMIDIDHFKRINDAYGHHTGDDVLREVARRLAAGIRSGDLLARYGGEEFVVLLLDADDEPSSQRIERLRADISSTPVDTRRAGPVPVTISIGMAHLAGDDLDQLLVRADAALYRAKRDGRDRLVVG